MVKQMERGRGRLLDRALELHRDREARPVWSWPERDKLTSTWLLLLPTPETSLCAAEFTEAAAAMLCLPSPACASTLGEKVSGQVKVGQFGDKVVNAKMRGDGWRTLHNAPMLLRIQKLFRWAPMPIVFEVFNLFAACIPQEGLARIERGRKRQGLVPDAKVPGEKRVPATLCELKLVSASKSWYPRNPRPCDGVRGVDRRAAGLTESYASKARNVDWSYCGTASPPGNLRRGLPAVREIGPVHCSEYKTTKLWACVWLGFWCFGRSQSRDSWTGEESGRCYAGGD